MTTSPGSASATVARSLWRMFAFVARSLTTTRMSSFGTPKPLSVRRTSETSFTQPESGGMSGRSYTSTPTKTILILFTRLLPSQTARLSHPRDRCQSPGRALDTCSALRGMIPSGHVVSALRIRKPTRVPVLRRLRRAYSCLSTWEHARTSARSSLRSSATSSARPRGRSRSTPRTSATRWPRTTRGFARNSSASAGPSRSSSATRCAGSSAHLGRTGTTPSGRFAPRSRSGTGSPRSTRRIPTGASMSGSGSRPARPRRARCPGDRRARRWRGVTS